MNLSTHSNTEQLEQGNITGLESQLQQRPKPEEIGQKCTDWKPIPEFEGYYEINLNGEIRGVDRYDRFGRFRPGKIMKLGKAIFGYLQVQLSKEGKQHVRQVHRLLKITFHSPPPFEKAQVRHYDGNPLNNSLDNLVWGTAQDNKDDQFRHGRTNRGEENVTSKLSEFDIKRLRELSSIGVTNIEISKIFNVTQTTVCDVLKGRSWGWLNEATN